MKVAVAKYRIGQPADFDAFAARQRAMLAEAAHAGASLAVLPEYLSLELAATFAPEVTADLHASLAATQAYRDAWLALFAGLSRELGLVIQAGTFLTDAGAGATATAHGGSRPTGGAASRTSCSSPASRSRPA